MNSTREIYWNVGHAVLIPMYLFAFVAIIVLFYGFYKRYNVYKTGKPENRFDTYTRRLIYFLNNFFLQRKVLRVFVLGSIHAMLFWSFLILFLGTTLIFIQADIIKPLFGIIFLKGSFYKFFSLVLDLAGFFAILMILSFIVRRFIVKPAGLETTKDDVIIPILLLLILISGFVVEGLRMAETEINLTSNLMLYSPVGLLFANFFTFMSANSILITHKLVWWTHFFLSITFIATIPYLKLRHIFVTPINYFFKDFASKGKLINIDIEDENREVFGVNDIKEYTWKDIYDSDACTKCKRCQDRCPAYLTNKPLSPMKVINNINDMAFKRIEDNTLIDMIGEDAIWSCTTCMACQEICPADIEHIRKIVEMRRYLVLMEGEFPGEEVRLSISNVEVNGNPFGNSFADRHKWAEELNIKLLSEDNNVDIMYFVGCYASYDPRNIKIAKSFIKICEAAQIKVGILGSEEKCCGDPVRKTGNEYLYQMIAKENIEKINSYNISKIVTTCPHCYNTLSKDYRDLGLSAEVVPYIKFLNYLIEEKRINIQKYDFDCTYHDSCYVGRYNGLFEEQRNIIRFMGGNLKEMEEHHRESFCCGGGGGRIIADEKIGEKISVRRIEMAKNTGQPLVVSNCPFCLTMFEDGIKLAEHENILKAKDLAELVSEHLA